MTSMSPTATPGQNAALDGAETHRLTGTPSKADPLDSPSQPNPDAEALAKAHSEARSRAESGDLTGARTLLEDALAVGEVRLGHAHPRLAPLMVDLATIARNLGNLTEARTQLRRAYAIIVAASGPEHATALSIEGRLAAVTYRLGEPTEAYDWHLADVGARVLGEEHPAIRGAQERLARRPPRTEPVASHYVPSPEAPGVYNRVEPEAPPPGPASYAPGSYEAGAYPPGQQEVMPQAAEPSVPGPYPSAPYEPSGIYTVETPEREYEEADVWRDPLLEPTKRRGHGGGIAVVVSLGAAILIAAAVVAAQLFIPRQTAPPAAAPTPATGTATPAPTTAVPAVSPSPTDVTIQDNGGSVTLTWIDPSGGKVPFIVAGGREGTTSAPLETVPAGRTTLTIHGLNVNHNYCYTVTAVWSSEMIAPSIRTCTHRISTSGAP
jgi:hypothetical protein